MDKDIKLKEDAMRIVHICNSVNESSAYTRMHKAFLQRGIDSTILTLTCNGNIEKMEIYKPNIREKIKDTIIYDIDRFILCTMHKTAIGIPFFLGRMGHSIEKSRSIIDSDIIHIHWICGFLSINNIHKLMKMGKPIVITMHDSWLMTGGCNVRYGCERFIESCGKCPEINSNNEKDLSYIIMKLKKIKWANNNFVIVTPSKWMQDNAQKSSLLKNNMVVHIPNYLDICTFNLKTKKTTKCEINILFGAVGVTLPHKGFVYFDEVMNRLFEERKDIAKKIKITIFGNDKISNSNINRKYKCEYKGYISNENEMAELYKNSDIYFFPSIDDNLPGTVMESLACGTPVLAFETGGVPEMVKHKMNGYVAKYKDINDLYDGLCWMIENDRYYEMIEYARKSIECEFNYENTIEKYINIYEMLVNREQ